MVEGVRRGFTSRRRDPQKREIYRYRFRWTAPGGQRRSAVVEAHDFNEAEEKFAEEIAPPFRPGTPIFVDLERDDGDRDPRRPRRQGAGLSPAMKEVLRYYARRVGRPGLYGPNVGGRFESALVRRGLLTTITVREAGNRRRLLYTITPKGVEAASSTT